ncbi:MAG: ankyrin repeat domain-containing protein, partial [Planctomycetota bacterium]|nr:ankyrin repeat domain-containing protein [Planctomycetota bacterium]
PEPQPEPEPSLASHAAPPEPAPQPAPASADDGSEPTAQPAPYEIPRGNPTSVRAIDCDGTAKLGEPAGLKYSSAYAPPELAREIHAFQAQDHGGDGDDDHDHDDDEAEALRWEAWLAARSYPLKAATTIDVWMFGMLCFQMGSRDGAPVFNSTNGDDLVEPADLATLAFGWPGVVLAKLRRIVWPELRDLALWCLQAEPSRRPPSFEDVLSHRFFAPSGPLRHPGSIDDWDAFVAGQARLLHEAIARDDAAAVQALLDGGVAHLTMLHPDDAGRGITPAHRAARLATAAVLALLLRELPPAEHGAAIVDRQTRYGFTPYMLACECGNLDAVRLLVDAGCATDATESRGGQTGLELAIGRQRRGVEGWLWQRAADGHEALRQERVRWSMRPKVRSQR